MNKNLGHSEKKIFNKHFQGANSELNSLSLYIYIFSKENTLNSEEWPNLEQKKILNAMAQVFPLLILQRVLNKFFRGSIS